MTESKTSSIAAANLGEDIGLDDRFNDLNRWSYLMMNVFEAKGFLKLAETTHAISTISQMDEILTQQALFRSFIISYAKSFISSGKGRSKLDPSKVFQGHEGAIAIHDRLISFRHKFAAHSDDSELEDAVIKVKEFEDHYLISNLYTLTNPVNEYQSYFRTIEILEEYIVVAINKALDFLERKLGKKILVQN